MRKRQADKADRGNRDAVEIILAHPEDHDGLAQMWARLWLDRHPSHTQADGENEEDYPKPDNHQRQLFENKKGNRV
jgi:hypothetical protein